MASDLVEGDSGSSFLDNSRAYASQSPRPIRGAVLEQVWMKIKEVGCSIRLLFIVLFAQWSPIRRL